MSGTLAALEAGEAAFDAWAGSMGGYTSPAFRALHDEATEFAAPGGYADYLDMARSLDEEHAARSARREAERRAREAVRRTEEAAAAVLERATEIKLAVEELSKDPRVAGGWDLGGPGLTSAEVQLELRYALGVATRAPGAFMASLPAVGDLARVIGIRS
jgi:hypothetical protein